MCNNYAKIVGAKNKLLRILFFEDKNAEFVITKAKLEAEESGGKVVLWKMPKWLSGHHLDMKVTCPCETGHVFRKEFRQGRACVRCHQED